MTTLRRVSCFLLVMLLAITQANSAQQSSLGSIVSAVGARMGTSPASAGSTVFGGERFLTGDDGMLLVQVGAAQLYLAGASGASLRRIENSGEAALEAGTLSVSTSRADALHIDLGGATIRPLADVPSYAQTTLVEPRVFLITILRGSWEFSYRCERETLREGSSFRLYLDRARPCGDDHTLPQKIKVITRPSRMGILVVGAPAVGGIAWGLHEAFESPHRP
ncbi:MAG: hypothetical protein LAN71_16515 [Acidobacteriia bacterium]|nr:hypothetical protein [Terriglobia bacterium]